MESKGSPGSTKEPVAQATIWLSLISFCLVALVSLIQSAGYFIALGVTALLGLGVGWLTFPKEAKIVIGFFTVVGGALGFHLHYDAGWGESSLSAVLSVMAFYAGFFFGEPAGIRWDVDD